VLAVLFLLPILQSLLAAVIVDAIVVGTMGMAMGMAMAMGMVLVNEAAGMVSKIRVDRFYRMRTTPIITMMIRIMQ
jgi:hypothetical protein